MHTEEMQQKEYFGTRKSDEMESGLRRSDRQRPSQDKSYRQEADPQAWSLQELEQDQDEWDKQEEERRLRRKQRIERMKREKRRRELLYRFGVPGAALFFLLFGVRIGGALRIHAGSSVQGLQRHKQVGIGGALRIHAAEQYQEPGQNITEDNITYNILSALGRGLENVSPESAVPGGEGYQTGDTEPEDDGRPAGDTGAAAASFVGPMPQKPETTVFEAHSTENTNGFSDEISSSYGILIDVESGEILAQKGAVSRISPASMTKILTVLVAAEHVTDLDDTFTMTIDITDYSFVNQCSNVGFEVDETITVRDLFYGTILKSGADAAVGLATYVAGSHEAFVDMMNEKLEELGLSESTHFTNCVGLYDENHYSTVYDMGVILKAAADNQLCREILSEHIYTTSSTPQHPEGITISNWFLRRIEDRDTHGEVLCAKTGYVVQSKSCAASLAVDHGGREYLCVTAGSDSNWTCIADHVKLYQRYLE